MYINYWKRHLSYSNLCQSQLFLYLKTDLNIEVFSAPSALSQINITAWSICTINSYMAFYSHEALSTHILLHQLIYLHVHYHLHQCTCPHPLIFTSIIYISARTHVLSHLHPSSTSAHTLASSHVHIYHLRQHMYSCPLTSTSIIYISIYTRILSRPCPSSMLAHALGSSHVHVHHLC